jgi:hypothetical protein
MPMTLQAQDLINDAIGLAFPYIRETDIAPGTLLKHLTWLDQEVMNLYALHMPERITTEGSDITVVFASNVNGYPLAASAWAYLDLVYVDNQGFAWPLNIVPEDKFDHPMKHPAVLIRGATFYPCDPAEVRWNLAFDPSPRQFYVGNGDVISYDYVATGVKITSLSQNLLSPDEGRNYIVADLALEILLTSENVPQTRLQKANEQRTNNRNGLLMNIVKRTDGSWRAFEARY